MQCVELNINEVLFKLSTAIEGYEIVNNKACELKTSNYHYKFLIISIKLENKIEMNFELFLLKQL